MKTTILTDNNEGLQCFIDRVINVCEKYSMKFTSKKIQIMIISKNQIINARHFASNDLLKITDKITY